MNTKKETTPGSRKFTRAEWTSLYEMAINAQDKLREIERALATEMEMSPQELAECRGYLWEVVGDLTQASIAVDKLTTTMFGSGMAGWGDGVEMVGYGKPLNWEGRLTAEEILDSTREERLAAEPPDRHPRSVR